MKTLCLHWIHHLSAILAGDCLKVIARYSSNSAHPQAPGDTSSFVIPFVISAPLLLDTFQRFRPECITKKLVLAFLKALIMGLIFTMFGLVPTKTQVFCSNSYPLFKSFNALSIFSCIICQSYLSTLSLAFRSSFSLNSLS